MAFNNADETPCLAEEPNFGSHVKVHVKKKTPPLNRIGVFPRPVLWFCTIPTLRSKPCQLILFISYIIVIKIVNTTVKKKHMPLTYFYFVFFFLLLLINSRRSDNLLFVESWLFIFIALTIMSCQMVRSCLLLSDACGS